ncbi:hypothetical protein EDB83DRAFT_230393 [Lactarius deliciosus]|nr:hypothetical protein EDB83DRAFT_230393 [Lactarius deliciosus]
MCLLLKCTRNATRGDCEGFQGRNGSTHETVCSCKYLSFTGRKCVDERRTSGKLKETQTLRGTLGSNVSNTRITQNRDRIRTRLVHANESTTPRQSIIRQRPPQLPFGWLQVGDRTAMHTRALFFWNKPFIPFAANNSPFMHNDNITYTSLFSCAPPCCTIPPPIPPVIPVLSSAAAFNP